MTPRCLAAERGGGEEETRRSYRVDQFVFHDPSSRGGSSDDSGSNQGAWQAGWYKGLFFPHHTHSLTLSMSLQAMFRPQACQ